MTATIFVTAARETNAVLTASSAVGSNSFTTAASFCPTTRPSGIEWIDGFETGRLIGGHGFSQFFTGANTAQLLADTAVARYGTYSVKVAPNAVATYIEGLFPVENASGTVRFAVRLASLPSADVELMRIQPLSGGQPLQLMYHTSTQKFALQFVGNTSVESSSTVSAATWYLIEIKEDMSTTTWSANWRVNKVDQSARTLSVGATGKWYAFYLGTLSAATYTANYDDVAVSSTGADYPLGDGKVLILRPNGMGTHNTSADFQNNDATAINSTSYQRLDDTPMNTSTDYIKQVTALSTAYIELTMADTTETCVRLVQGDLLYDPLNSNQSNNGKTSIFDGSTESIVYS
ncbi:MAG: hypothetical protein M3Q30_23610, partial [Actinomycetota bacterium]|nr:hypothetical protein [Actinomycetota bacterium]